MKTYYNDEASGKRPLGLTCMGVMHDAKSTYASDNANPHSTLVVKSLNIHQPAANYANRLHSVYVGMNWDYEPIIAASN